MQGEHVARDTEAQRVASESDLAGRMPCAGRAVTRIAALLRDSAAPNDHVTWDEV